MSHAVDCYGLTDPGRVRAANEDQFLIADLGKFMLVRQTSLPPGDHTRLLGPHQGHLLLVADGLGGPAGGGRASRLATETLVRYVLATLPWFHRLRHDEEHDLGEELVAALEGCQRAVREAQVADPGRGRMGTTLTMAYVLWPRLYVVHAGDSRAYLLRGGSLHRLTRDHTVARQLVEAGRMAPEEAEHSRWSHVLYNCVGGSRDELAPDVRKAALRPGDVVLLCTDGLTKHVPDDRVAEVLGSGGAEAAARRLVAEANAAGGSDNVTAVVARFAGEEPPAP